MDSDQLSVGGAAEEGLSVFEQGEILFVQPGNGRFECGYQVLDLIVVVAKPGDQAVIPRDTRKYVSEFMLRLGIFEVKKDAIFGDEVFEIRISLLELVNTTVELLAFWTLDLLRGHFLDGSRQPPQPVNVCNTGLICLSLPVKQRRFAPRGFLNLRFCFFEDFLVTQVNQAVETLFDEKDDSCCDEAGT